jgi:hypothetical protein
MPKITIEFTGDDITLQVLDRIRALFTGAPVLPAPEERPTTGQAPTTNPAITVLSAAAPQPTASGSAVTAPSSAQAITPAATTAPSSAGPTATNGASPSDEAALRLQMTNAINAAQTRGGTIENVKAVFVNVGGVNRGRDVPAALLPQVIAAINGINAK